MFYFYILKNSLKENSLILPQENPNQENDIIEIRIGGSFQLHGKPIAHCNSFTASVSFLASLLFLCLDHGVGSSRGLKDTGVMRWPGFALNPCMQHSGSLPPTSISGDTA